MTPLVCSILGKGIVVGRGKWDGSVSPCGSILVWEVGCAWTNNPAQVGSQAEEVHTKGSEITYLFQVETKAAKIYLGDSQRDVKNSRVLKRLEWKIQVVNYKQGWE